MLMALFLTPSTFETAIKTVNSSSETGSVYGTPTHSHGDPGQCILT